MRISRQAPTKLFLYKIELKGLTETVLAVLQAPDDIVWGAFSTVTFSSWDVHVIACTCQGDEDALLLIIERLRYPGLRVRVSPFCLSISADVSIFTRNFYPFPRGKPWSTRKRQTGTGVFCLLFVGRFNGKNFNMLLK
jgi:hypothetical protein